MQRWLEAGLLVCLVGALAGCGAVTPKPQYTRLGLADPEADKRVTDRYLAIRKSTDVDLSKARVFVDTIPEGLRLQDGQLSVEDGYAHKIVGKFVLLNTRKRLYWFPPFFDYEDKWRKGFCYWQVPLVWATLGVWSISPTAIPCHPAEKQPKAVWVKEVRAVAIAGNADSAIMSYVSPWEDEAAGAAGFLFHIDPALADGVKTTPMVNDHLKVAHTKPAPSTQM